jgi:MscS family membrane protein
MRIESFSARDRFRLTTTLALVQSTTPEQVRAIVAAVEAELLKHPARGPDAPAVRLVELGESALKIEVMAWLQAGSWDDFARQRTELLLSFLEIVKGAGTTFAYPTQTLHVASLPRAP